VAPFAFNEVVLAGQIVGVVALAVTTTVLFTVMVKEVLFVQPSTDVASMV